jgi:hypothetical protein
MRTLTTLALAATAALLTGGPAHATTPADALPAYLCERELPAPHIWPRWIHGGECTPSPGAPTEGHVRGPVFIKFHHPHHSTWRCAEADVRRPDHHPHHRVEVFGKNCVEER